MKVVSEPTLSIDPDGRLRCEGGHFSFDDAAGMEGFNDCHSAAAAWALSEANRRLTARSGGILSAIDRQLSIAEDMIPNGEYRRAANPVDSVALLVRLAATELANRQEKHGQRT